MEKELSVSLYSDFTYVFNTYWGTYYGNWEVVESYPFDKIHFFDNEFISEGIFYSSHISMSDKIVASIENHGYTSGGSYVAMFDLTGEAVPYDNVCFLDSDDIIIVNIDKTDTVRFIQSIPTNTSKIGMIGEYGNISACFECDYSEKEGSIAFIIGPPEVGVYISKERSTIRYRFCYCDDYMDDCAVVFTRI